MLRNDLIFILSKKSVLESVIKTVNVVDNYFKKLRLFSFIFYLVLLLFRIVNAKSTLDIS